MIVERDNKVLEVHPPAGDRHLSVNGSSWLWAVTAIFLLSFLVVLVLSWRPRFGERVFHYIFATTMLVGAIAYYAMASDLAWVVIAQANERDRGFTRQIFWAKYVYWTVSFPAAAVALGLLSGVTWATIAYTVVLSWIWIISFLISAFTPSNYKWGFFAFGMLAYVVVLFGTFTHGRRSAAHGGYQSHFTGLSGWFHLLWLLYPIAFGVSDGGNVIGVTPSFIFFGILDILMIPVLAFTVIFLSRRWDYGRLGFHFTRRHRGYTGPYDEKPVAAPSNGTRV